MKTSFDSIFISSLLLISVEFSSQVVDLSLSRRTRRSQLYAPAEETAYDTIKNPEKVEVAMVLPTLKTQELHFKMPNGDELDPARKKFWNDFERVKKLLMINHYGPEGSSKFEELKHPSAPEHLQNRDEELIRKKLEEWQSKSNNQNNLNHLEHQNHQHHPLIDLERHNLRHFGTIENRDFSVDGERHSFENGNGHVTLLEPTRTSVSCSYELQQHEPWDFFKDLKH